MRVISSSSGTEESEGVEVSARGIASQGSTDPEDVGVPVAVQGVASLKDSGVAIDVQNFDNFAYKKDAGLAIDVKYSEQFDAVKLDSGETSKISPDSQALSTAVKTIETPKDIYLKLYKQGEKIKMQLRIGDEIVATKKKGSSKNIEKVNDRIIIKQGGKKYFILLTVYSKAKAALEKSPKMLDTVLKAEVIKSTE